MSHLKIIPGGFIFVYFGCEVLQVSYMGAYLRIKLYCQACLAAMCRLRFPILLGYIATCCSQNKHLYKRLSSKISKKFQKHVFDLCPGTINNGIGIDRE